jgi:hypothetical protein
MDIGFLEQGLGVRDVNGMSARKQKAQRYAIGVAKHMNLSRQATATAA